MIQKIRMIFNRTQKIKFVVLFCMLFAGSVLELMGVSLILPPPVFQTTETARYLSRLCP